MSESLLSPSRIALFGRVVEDLHISAAAVGEASSPSLLEQQLRAKDACFARIYGFSYEGLFHVLPHPALVLVHGDGAPTHPDQLGQAGDAPTGLPEGLRSWAYDKGDYTMLLQIHSGTLDQLLLQGEGPHVGMSLRGMSAPGPRGMSAPGPRGMSAPGPRGMSAPGPRDSDDKDD